MLYTVFPTQASVRFVIPESSQFGCVIPSFTHTFNIQSSTEEFFNNHCKTCPINTSFDEVRKQLQNNGIVPTSGRMYKYAADEGLCLGQPTSIYVCPEGHPYLEIEPVTVVVPETLWMYSSLVKGAEKWRIYDIQMVQDDCGDAALIKPFRMCNMYESGAICFGKANKVPKTLREAYNTYFNSTFNAQHQPKNLAQVTLSEALKSYNPEETPGEWTDFSFADVVTSYNEYDAASLDPETGDVSWINKYQEHWLLFNDKEVGMKTGAIDSKSSVTTVASREVLLAALTS